MNTGFPRALSCSWHPIPGLPAENHLNVLRLSFPNFGNQDFIFIGIKNFRCYSVLNMRFFFKPMLWWVLSAWQNNAQVFVSFGGREVWFLVPRCQMKGKTHKTQTCFELNIVFVWHCATHLQVNSNTLVKVKQMRRPMQIAPWMQKLFHEVFHMIPNTKKNVCFVL